MRFFEFSDTNAGIDKFINALRNHIGRAASKKSPAKLNWQTIAGISNSTGFEFSADYETFKTIYDSNPALQTMIKDFNDRGVELMVPGLPEEPNTSGTKEPEDEIGRIADANAAKQLSQNQQGIKV